MAKAQSFIIEFILFFIISFSLFTTISYYFYSQNEFYKERVGDYTRELVNDLVATNIVEGVTCKSCDEFMATEEIPSKIGGFYYRIGLNDDVVNTTLFSPEPSSEQTSLFNLNETFNFIGSTVSENKRAEIKINNVQEEVKIE